MRKNREHTVKAAGEITAFPVAPAASAIAASFPDASCGCPAREPGDRAGWSTRLAAVLAVCGVALLFAMVLAAALPVLLRPGPGWPLEWLWQPYQGHFGILPMCLGSLALAAFSHVMTAIFLLLTGLAAGLSWPWYVICLGIAALLLLEHRLMRPQDLRHVNTAFFTLNGIISPVVLAGVILGIYL